MSMVHLQQHRDFSVKGQKLGRTFTRLPRLPGFSAGFLAAFSALHIEKKLQNAQRGAFISLCAIRLHGTLAIVPPEE